MRQGRITGRKPKSKVGEINLGTGLPIIGVNKNQVNRGFLARLHQRVIGKDILRRAAKVASKSRTVQAVTKPR